MTFIDPSSLPKSVLNAKDWLPKNAPSADPREVILTMHGPGDKATEGYEKSFKLGVSAEEFSTTARVPQDQDIARSDDAQERIADSLESLVTVAWLFFWAKVVITLTGGHPSDAITKNGKKLDGLGSKIDKVADAIRDQK